MQSITMATRVMVIDMDIMIMIINMKGLTAWPGQGIIRMVR